MEEACKAYDLNMQCDLKAEIDKLTDMLKRTLSHLQSMKDDHWEHSESVDWLDDDIQEWWKANKGKK